MSEKNRALEQAAAQYESIAAMVAALGCDFDRLEELREERSELEGELRESLDAYKEAQEKRTGDVDTYHALQDAQIALKDWETDNAPELAGLEAEAGGYASLEAVEEAISEDPLSVEVRSGWHSIGEDLEASEFSILLCTGVPAVRIMGELDNGKQPCRAWLEYQDWGTPWTQYSGATQSHLLAYCARFYFGD